MMLLELTTAIFLLVTAIVGLVIKAKVEEVHVLVNDRMTETLTRVDQLVLALTEAGVDVPAVHRDDRQVGESE